MRYCDKFIAFRCSNSFTVISEVKRMRICVKNKGFWLEALTGITLKIFVYILLFFSLPFAFPPPIFSIKILHALVQSRNTKKKKKTKRNEDEGKFIFLL